MPAADRILDLLAAWQAAHDRGQALSPQELAPDAPSAWDELARRIARRQRLHAAEPAPAGLPSVPGYRVLGEVAVGGQAVVYKAVDESLNRPVALKVIGCHARPTAAAEARFRVEAAAVAKLGHPHIVQVYGFGQVDRLLYLALEWVDGGTLHAAIGGRPQDPHRAADRLAAVARAVQFAHAAGVVHRDLKPGNILLTPAGVPKVADFGLAKLVDADPAGAGHRTATMAVLGTPGYMAPEQVSRGTAPVGPAADVYALGAVLYHLLTGRPPFQTADPLDALDLARRGAPDSPRSLVAAVPRDLETVCLKAMRRDPAERYPSAAAVADDLDRFLRGEPVRARPVSAAVRAGRWVRRNPYQTALAAVVGASLAVIATGAGVAASVLRGERDRANRAETEYALELADIQLDRARTARGQARAGRRDRSLALVRDAVRLLAGHAPPGDDRWDRAREAAVSAFHVPDFVPEADVPVPAYQSVACDPALGRVAVSEAGGPVTVRDLADGRVLWTVPAGATGSFAELGFSPDGRLLVVARKGEARRYESEVWELAGEGARRLALPGRVFANGFSGDSGRVCHQPPGGRLRVLDARTGAVVRADVVDGLVLDARFSPDGTRLAAATDRGRVHVVDTATWAAGPGIDVHISHVALGWDGAGRRLVTGTGNGTVAAWDAATGKPVWSTPAAHAGQVVWSEFAADPPAVVTTAWDQTVKLWDPDTGRPGLTVPGAYAKVVRGRAVVADPPRLTRGRLDDGVCRAVARVPGAVTGVHFSPDGALAVATVCRGLEFHTLGLDPLTAEVRVEVPAGHVEHALFHPSRGEVYTHGTAGVVRWPVARPAAGRWSVGPPSPVLATGYGGYARIAWDRGGGRLAAADNAPDKAAGNAGRIVVSTDAGGGRVDLRGGPRQMTGPSVTPDGSAVATAAWGCPDVYVWDVARPDSPRRLPVGGGDPGPLVAARFSPDGSRLVAFARAAGGRARVRAWRTADWAEVWSADGEGVASEAVFPPAFSPDGRFVAHPQSTRGFDVRDAATGRRVAAFARDDAVNPVPHAFGPDGRTLAVSTADARLEFWHLDRVRAALDAVGLTADDFPARPADAP